MDSYVVIRNNAETACLSFPLSVNILQNYGTISQWIYGC